MNPRLTSHSPSELTSELTSELPPEDRQSAASRSPWPVRAGMALLVAAYTAYSLFGVAAPFLWGHHGYHGATYMLRAVMSLRFHIDRKSVV